MMLRALTLLCLCALGLVMAKIPPPDNTAIWRTQIAINTGAAKTDQNVFVQLTKASNFFFLDNSQDNFEFFAQETFDVVGYPGVGSLGDITRLRICKPSSGSWQVTRIALIINNQVLFDDKTTHNFNGQNQCVEFSKNTLHTHGEWFIQQPDNTNPNANALCHPPARITAPLVTSIVEGVISNASDSGFLPSELYWDGDQPTTVTNILDLATLKLSPNSLHVSLHFGYSVPVLPDPHADVDFDLVVSCGGSPQALSLKIANVVLTLHSNFFVDFFTLGMESILLDLVHDGLEKQLKQFTNSFTISQNTLICPTITSKATPEVDINWPADPFIDNALCSLTKEPSYVTKVCPTSNGKECSGHGTCDIHWTGSFAQCSCDAEFGGSDCHITCPLVAGGKCGGSVHGVCNHGTCDCNDIWGGDNCIDTCTPTPPYGYCTGNGTCTNGYCFCNPGYGGINCEKPDFSYHGSKILYPIRLLEIGPDPIDIVARNSLAVNGINLPGFTIAVGGVAQSVQTAQANQVVTRLG